MQIEAAAPAYAEPTLPAIGVDAGLNSLIALSTGQDRTAPAGEETSEAAAPPGTTQGTAAQGQSNRRRTVARLNRVHARLAARRQDFTHKLTRTLIDRHVGRAVEKLRLKGLMRTRMAKSFADAGIGEMLRQLCYKAEWAGREYREMPTFDRSTGVCPECGWVGPRLPLAMREWRCDGCGAMHDRDTAAAKAIFSARYRQ